MEIARRGIVGGGEEGVARSAGPAAQAGRTRKLGGCRVDEAEVELAVVSALVWLHTGTGARKLAGIVTDEARGAIRGLLSLRSIEVRGFLTICADDVDLRDPDGNPALAADRVCLHVNPLALRTNKVLLSDVQLIRPRIDIAAVETPPQVAEMRHVTLENPLQEEASKGLVVTETIRQAADQR